MQAEGGPGQGAAVRVVAPGQVGGLPEGLAGAGGVAGAAQRLAQAGQQPGLARRVELPGRLAELQRPPVVAGSVLVGQDGRGLLGGPLAVGDGPGRGRRGELPALVHGPQVVAGELGGSRLRPAAARRLQGGGGLEVEPGPGRRVELAVQDLAEQVMGEPPGAELAGRGDQHPGPGGLAEQGQHRAGGLAGHGGQDLGPEVGTEHRGRLQQPEAGVAEGGQPAQDRIAHPVRDLGGARVGDQQPADLLDEERVAAGAPPHARAQLGVGLAAGDAGEHLGDLGGVEAAQGQGPALGLQPGDRAGQRVAGRHLDVAVGDDQQLGAAAGPPGVEGGQLDRCRVGPVEVVEHDHQRPGPGGLEQGGADGVEVLEPGRGRRRPRRRRRPAPVLEAGVDAERGQGLQPGPERRGALPARPPYHRGTPLLGVVGGRRGQGGLADPGLAGEGDDPAPGGQRGLDQGPQLSQRPVPADQTRRGRDHGTRRSSPDPSGARPRVQQALMASRSWICCTVPSETVSMK